MAALAMNLLPMFLGSGSGGISGILGNVTSSFGNLISGVGNTLTGMGGDNKPVLKKSNKTIYYVIGGISTVMVLGLVIVIAKKK
jgi:hypothetical protein